MSSRILDTGNELRRLDVDADDDVEDDAILLEAENIDGALGEWEVFAADNESSFDLPVVNWEDGVVGLLLVEDDGDCSAD